MEKDGQVSYKEFVDSCLISQGLLKEYNLRIKLKHFDKEKKGVIQIKQLKELVVSPILNITDENFFKVLGQNPSTCDMN